MKEIPFCWRARSVAVSALAGLLVLGCSALVVTGCGKSSSTSKVSGEVSVEEMNSAIQMMSMSPLGGPKTVGELTNFPALKGRPFPAPPAGKKFAIDPATHRVVIVKQ